MRKESKYYQKAIVKCKNKQEDFMCRRLNELCGKSAEEILKESGESQSVPVDLLKILKKIKVPIFSRTFEDIQEIEGKGYIAGLVLVKEDNIGIFYNKNDSFIQQKFTIAHELGHCCLHGSDLKKGYIEFLHKDGYQNRHEAEASEFAARLLIPEYSLISVYNQLVIPSLEALADIFEVPKHLMVIRLKDLKLKFYLDEKQTYIG